MKAFVWTLSVIIMAVMICLATIIINLENRKRDALHLIEGIVSNAKFVSVHHTSDDRTDNLLVKYSDVLISLDFYKKHSYYNLNVTGTKETEYVCLLSESSDKRHGPTPAMSLLMESFPKETADFGKYFNKEEKYKQKLIEKYLKEK